MPYLTETENSNIQRQLKGQDDLIEKLQEANGALLEACKEAEEMLSIDASGASARFLSALQIVRVSLRQAIAKAEQK